MPPTKIDISGVKRRVFATRSPTDEAYRFAARLPDAMGTEAGTEALVLLTELYETNSASPSGVATPESPAARPGEVSDASGTAQKG